MSHPMKKSLTRLRLIQWHCFANETITLRGSNLLSGENGAGKSTILDAIQLLLTTNTRRFNMAANAESRRDLKGYVRGKTGVDGQEYLRKGAVISYAALEVYEEKNGRYFVLGAKFDSPDVESDIKTRWFCEEGTLDDLSFIVDNKPAVTEKFCNRGKKVSFIYQNSAARDRFRYRLGSLPKQFGEMLAKSIAFRPAEVGNVNQFVSRFILEERNVEIDTLRENIRNLSEFRRLVNTVREKITQLEQIRRTHQEMLQYDEQILVIDILLCIAELEAKRAECRQLTAQIEAGQRESGQLEQQKSALEQSIRGAEEQLCGIRVQLSTGQNALRISQLEGQIQRGEKDQQTAAADLQKLEAQLQNLTEALRCIQDTLTENVQLSLLKQAEAPLAEKTRMIQAVQAQVQTAAAQKRDAGSLLRAETIQQQKRLEALAAEIHRLENNQLTYDRNVTGLKEAIEREFASRGIRSAVHIFAELLDIADDRWQQAVEGYLHTQRFHLLTEPEYYDIAAQVYDRLKHRFHTAAIVNTGRLTLHTEPEPGTLAAVVTSGNRYARAYANYLLGRVKLCSDAAELKQHSIAVTQGCMLYQGRALRRLDPKICEKLYIGRNAVQQQLQTARAEYEQLTVLHKENQTRLTVLVQDAAALEKCNFEILFEVLDAPRQKAQIDAALDELCQKLNEARQDQTFLMLQQEEERLEKQIGHQKQQSAALMQRIACLLESVRSMTQQTAVLETEMAAAEQAVAERSRENDHLLEEAQRRFREHMKSKSAGTIHSNYQPRRAELENKREAARRQLYQQQFAYENGELGTGPEMMPAYEAQYETLSRHDLILYEEKLRQAQENAEVEFRESFLAKLRENMESAKNTFRELNKTLKPIYYGNDSYRFEYTPNPKKKRLYDMIVSDFNVGGFSLFSDQFDAQYHDEMEELFAKLTASDEGGEDVLREYTDYRRYMDYDIQIVSKNGTSQRFSKIYREKSGGETQTPYYVAIAASFVQLYRTGETLRIILLDEAFDKMDEDRMESMIRFFRSQNFQMIFAAPTSRLEIIGEQVEQVILISRDSAYNCEIEEFSYDENRDRDPKLPG